jgi:hypothetical protein
MQLHTRQDDKDALVESGRQLLDAATAAKATAEAAAATVASQLQDEQRRRNDAAAEVARGNDVIAHLQQRVIRPLKAKLRSKSTALATADAAAAEDAKNARAAADDTAAARRDADAAAAARDALSMRCDEQQVRLITF